MSTIPEESYQFKNLVLSDKFLNESSKLTAVIGVDDNGEPILFDFAKNPHLFIGGDQGCGKSTLIHSIIMSLMQRNTPDEFQFVYLDAKGLDVNLYRKSKYLQNGREHHIVDVFNYLLYECNNRTRILSENKKKTVSAYNEFAGLCDMIPIPELFVFIDEVSYLLKENQIRQNIEKLNNYGRAVGIHLVIADTNPTFGNVLRIAKQIPNKIVFRFTYADYKALLERKNVVPLSDDGEILCDFGGAEYVHGHSCFVSEEDIKSEVEKNIIKEETQVVLDEQNKEDDNDSEWDSLLPKAIDFAVNNRKFMTSDLQKHLSIGYARASRIVDQLEEKGIVGYSQGVNPRECLIKSEEQLKQILGDKYVEAEIKFNELTEVHTDEIKENFEKTSKIDSVMHFILQNKGYIIYGAIAVILLIIVFFTLNSKGENIALVTVAALIIVLVVTIVKGIIKRHKIKSEAKHSKYSLYAIDSIPDGHDFEYVVADLLKKVGFYNVQVTVGSGDFGIDVLGCYGDASYAIQCKKYSDKVGVSAVQEAYAGRSYYGCNYAMVITNNYFTPAAIKLAKSTGVILWDRNNVRNLINGHV